MIFLKIELVVGTIKDAQEVPKSSKLLKLHVNFGPLGNRQILSGVRQFYKPEELIEKQAIFVYNLPPRQMMGLESQGMMLTAEADENTVKIVQPQIPMPNGTKLK